MAIQVYVNSRDANYKLLRELALPNLSYLSLMKLANANGDTVYYAKLFTDYLESFGEIEHPAAIEAGERMVEEDTSLTKEEKLSVVKARVGQGKYRRQLLDECPFCPITMVSDDRLLIASHIKPWAQSDNHEKVDPKNGFMFTPTIDYLFDQGFITFQDNKKLIVSPWLSKPTLSRLNLSNAQQVAHLPVAGREKYLEYHRSQIFKA